MLTRVPGRQRPVRFFSPLGAAAAAILVNAMLAHVAQAQPALPGARSPITPLLPPQSPSVAPGLPRGPVAPAPAEGANVVRAISEVSVDGATVYGANALAPLLRDLIGPAVPQAKIEAARAAIVDLYRSDGYVYTTVNATIINGRLRFVVVEGRITDVKLDGNIGPAGTQVLRFLNHLVDGQPLNVSSLERWLLLASDIPGVTVRSVLNPTDVPGELTLVAQVSRQAISGLVTADNRAANFTGPEEGLLVVDFNSFTEFGEKTELAIYSSYNGSQLFGQAASEFFIGGSGLKGRFYGGAGDSVPTGTLHTIGYNGTTTVFGASLSYPVIRERAQTVNVALYFDGVQSQVATNGAGANGGRGVSSYDSLRIVRIGADYTRLDTLLGDARSAVDSGNIRVSQGLTALGASANHSPKAPRTGENVGFTKFNAQISRNQTLFAPWESASVGVQQTLIGQATNDVLPPEETYYLGGPHFNRGYYYGQVTGDSAFVSSTELQLNTPLPVPESWGFDVSAQFYAFYDWGEVWQNLKADPNRVVNSTGLGVRTFITPAIEVDFEGAFRLNRFPNGTGPAVSPLNTGAFYWQLTGRF